MNRTLLTAIVSGALISCAPNTSAAYISSFGSLGAGCAVDTAAMTFKKFGRLDLANGAVTGLPKYWLQMNVTSTVLTPPVTLQNGTPLELSDRERYKINAIHLTYQIKKGGGATKTLPVTDDVAVAVLATNAQISNMFVNLIGPKGAATLLNEVPATTSTNGLPTPDDYVELKVGVSAVGSLSGSGTPLTTGVEYFPLTVYRSAACTAGYKSPDLSCPSPGQDTGVPECN